MLNFEGIIPSMPTKKFVEAFLAYLYEKKYQLIKIKPIISKIGMYVNDHPDENHLLGGLHFRVSATGYVCAKLEDAFRDVCVDTDYLRKTLDPKIRVINMTPREHDKIIDSVKPEYRGYILAIAEFVAKKEEPVQDGG